MTPEPQTAERKQWIRAEFGSGDWSVSVRVRGWRQISALATIGLTLILGGSQSQAQEPAVAPAVVVVQIPQQQLLDTGASSAERADLA